MNGITERTTWSMLGMQVRRRMPVTSAVILAVLLAGCGSMNPSEDDTALTGDEITKLITGITFRGGWEGQQLMVMRRCSSRANTS